MIKKRKKPGKTILTGIIFILCGCLITIIVWKFRSVVQIKDEKIELFNSKKAAKKPMYDMYKVSTSRSDEGYYVKFSDVICDAAKDELNKPHYFRIDITFEVATQEGATIMMKAPERIIEPLRSVVANLRPIDISNEKVTNYIKTNAKIAAEKEFGYKSVKGVYFEQLLGQ